jgi:DNA-binding CsgD family transcriptional regulator
MNPATRRGGSLRSAARSAQATRGQARQFWRVFDESVVPMVIVDNHRRYLGANRAARLFFRLSLAEILDRRIDDITPAGRRDAMHDAWQRVMDQGCVAGVYDMGVSDGRAVRVCYCAMTNVLPGQHLIVFVPAHWPEDELGAGEHDTAPTATRTLSTREREVLTLIATGADSQQIADELQISQATVNTHVQKALRKLRARNRPHAIALAMQLGLIEPRLSDSRLRDQSVA